MLCALSSLIACQILIYFGNVFSTTDEDDMWQGKPECPRYCLEIRKCEDGASTRLRECGSTSRQKWKIDGSVIRPACSSSFYLSDGMIKKGSGSSLDFESSGKFEIRKNGKCLTNHHDPRDGELASFRNCERARKTGTEDWFWN